MSAASLRATETTPTPFEVEVVRESDATWAIGRVRAFCTEAGMRGPALAYVVTAAAELATNLWMHTDRGGRLRVASIRDGGRIGIELTAADDGPGIPDVRAAMREGFSTCGSLGCGLPGVERLMDSLSIDSAPGRGTRIIARKWARN